MTSSRGKAGISEAIEGLFSKNEILKNDAFGQDAIAVGLRRNAQSLNEVVDIHAFFDEGDQSEQECKEGPNHCLGMQPPAIHQEGDHCHEIQA